MSDTKTAFTAIREAIKTANEQGLTLQGLWKLQHDTLGRGSVVADFKDSLKAQLADLPKRSADRKKIHKIVKDINSVSRELREVIQAKGDVIRMAKAEDKDARGSARVRTLSDRLRRDMKALKELDAITFEAILSEFTESEVTADEAETVTN